MASFSGDQVTAIAIELLGQPNLKVSNRHEIRWGTRGSLSIDLASGTWFDHERGCGGGLCDLVAERLNLASSEARAWLQSRGVRFAGKTSDQSKIVAIYDYQSPDGALLYQVVRKEPKAFLQRQPDGGNGWVWSLKGVERVLYHLPELAASSPDEIVFFVEGEKDADALAALGLTATTNAGGANKWHAGYADALRGKRVTILPDNDLAGRDHAEAVKTHLAPVASAAAILCLQGLPERGDVSDWLASGATKDTLLSLAERALATSDAKHDTAQCPYPIFRPLSASSAPPIASTGPLRPAIEAIAALTQCPPGLAMQCVLGAASLVAQEHADVETLGGVAPLSLNSLTVAASGERKSGAFKHALEPIRDHERHAYEAYEDDQKRFALRSEAFESDQRAVLREAPSAGRDADLDALGDPPMPPLNPARILDDVTIEGVYRHFDEGQPSIGLFTDEAGVFFGGHAMNADNKMKTATALSTLWAAAPIVRTRAGTGIKRYDGRRTSCCFLIQQRLAERFLSDRDVINQGLSARFLMCWPESRIGYRSKASAEDEASARLKLSHLHNRFRELLDLGDEQRSGSPKLSPRVLSLGSEAKALLEEFKAALEIEQRPHGRLSDVTGIASKSAEQAARIAGILPLLHDPNAREVKLECLADGIALADWYLYEAARLLNQGEISKRAQEAELLRSWLVHKYPGQRVTVRTIVRKGPNALRETAKIKKLVAVLEEHGCLIPQPQDGRSIRYLVVA